MISHWRGGSIPEFPRHHYFDNIRCAVKPVKSAFEPKQSPRFPMKTTKRIATLLWNYDLSLSYSTWIAMKKPSERLQSHVLFVLISHVFPVSIPGPVLCQVAPSGMRRRSSTKGDVKSWSYAYNDGAFDGYVLATISNILMDMTWYNMMKCIWQQLLFLLVIMVVIAIVTPLLGNVTITKCYDHG